MKTFFFNPALRSKSPSDSSETTLGIESSSSYQSKKILQDQDIEYKLALDDFQHSQDLKELGFNYSGQDESLIEYDFISQEYFNEIFAGVRQLPDDEEEYNIFLKKLKTTVLKNRIKVFLYYDSELFKDDKIFDILFINSDIDEKTFNYVFKEPNLLESPHFYRIFLKSLKKSVSEKLLDFTEDHLIWASQRANEGYPEILEIMSGNHFMEKQQFADIVANKISIPQDLVAYRIFLAKLKNSVSSRKIEPTYDDLLWATKNGFYDILKTLFDGLSYYEKTEKYVFDKDQRTLLHHYALNEYGIALNQRMVELLIDNRVPLNSFDCYAKTALQYAILKDSYDLFMFLIDRNFWDQKTLIKTQCTVSEGFKEKKNCLDSVVELIEGKYARDPEDKKNSVILRYVEPILASGIFILNPFNISNLDYEELETFFVRINLIGNFFNLLCQDKPMQDRDSEYYKKIEDLAKNLMRNYFNSFIMLRLIDADQESFKNILLVYCPIEEAIEKIFPGQLFSQKIESRELKEIILQAVKDSEINYTRFISNSWIESQEQMFSLCPDLGIAIDRNGSVCKVDEELDQEKTFCISPLNYSLLNGRFVTALNLVRNGFDPNQIDSNGNISTVNFIKDYCEKFRNDIKKSALKYLVRVFVNQNLSIYPKLANASTTNSNLGCNLSFICFDFFAEYSRVIFDTEKNKNFILMVDQDAILSEDKFKNFKQIVSFYYKKYFSLSKDCPLEVVFDKVGLSEVSSKYALELSLELNEIFQKCRSPLKTGFLVKNIYFNKTREEEFSETFIPEYPGGKYQGQIQRGVPHGEGIITFEGGVICVGYFSNGFLNGFTTFIKKYFSKKKKNDTLQLYFINGVCTYIKENKIYELDESPFLKIKHANFIDSLKQYESETFLSPSNEEYRSYMALRALKLEESFDSTISFPRDYIEKIQENFFMLLTNNFLVFKDFNDAKAILKSKSREVLLIAKEKKDSLLKLIAEKQKKLDKLKRKELLSRELSNHSQSIKKIEKELTFYDDLLFNIDGHIKQIRDYSLSSAVEMSKSYRVKFVVNENDPDQCCVFESLYSAQKDLKKFIKFLDSNEENFICDENYYPIGLSIESQEYFRSYLENPETKEIDKEKSIWFLKNFVEIANDHTSFFMTFDVSKKNFEESEIQFMQILVEELSARNLIHFEEKLVELEHLQQGQQQTSEVQGDHNRFEDIIKECDDNLQKIKARLPDIDAEIDLIASIVKKLTESNQSSPQKPVEQPSSYLNLFSRFLKNRSASVVQLSESDYYPENLKNALLGIVKIKVRNEILIDSLQVDDYDDFKVGSAYLISQEQINELFETIERDVFTDQKFLRSTANYYKKENPNYVNKLKHYFHFKFEELLQKCLEEKDSRKHKENLKRRIYNFLKFCHVKDSLEIENLDADFHKSEGLGHATGASLDELKKSIFLLNKLQNIVNQKVSLAQYLEKLQDIVFNNKEDLQFSDKKQKYKEKLIELDDQSYLENLFMSLQSIAKIKSEFNKVSEEFRSEFVNFYLPYCFMLSEIYQIDSIAKEEDRCFMKSDLEKIQKIEQLKLSELNSDKDSIDFRKLFIFLKENPEILKIINNFALTLDIQNVDLLEKIEIAHDVFAKFSSDTESVDRYQVKNEDHYHIMKGVISSYFEEGYLMKIADFKRKNIAFIDRDKSPSAFELRQSRSQEKASQSPAKTKQDSLGVSQAKTSEVAEAKPDPRPVPKASAESAKQGKAK